MRTVRDESGDLLLLLTESSDACKVRDPETGEESYRDRDDLELASGESPLATAARAVPEPARAVLTAAHDERALGLLVDLSERGPHSVRHLLSATDLCESDLLGLLTEFRAAGLVEETDVMSEAQRASEVPSGDEPRGGERGYAATETADEGVALLTGE